MKKKKKRLSTAILWAGVERKEIFDSLTLLSTQGKGEEGLKLAKGGKESPGSDTTAERPGQERIPSIGLAGIASPPFNIDVL